jgi:uncharacterized protein (DUF362 family)
MKIALVKATYDNVYQAIRRGMQLVDELSICNEGTVIIKPNLCDLRNSESGCTTSPLIVESIIKYIFEHGSPKIKIVESDHWIATADECFEKLGYTELAQKYDVELVNLTKCKKTRVLIDGRYFKYLDIPDPLLKMDYFISVPKLKTHIQYKMTCVLKNQFGLLPMRFKSKYHPYMSEVLFDLNRLFKPDLCIVDGIVAMHGPGPSDGYPIQLNAIIIGKDAVATDCVAARLLGFNPRSIPYLNYAIKHNLSPNNKFELVGDAIRTDSEAIKFIPYIAYLLYRASLNTIKAYSSLEKGFRKLSDLLSLLATGLIVLKWGYLTSPTYGSLSRGTIKRYMRSSIRAFLDKLGLY